MPYSMTGFATAETAAGPFRLTWELRSVNHRYLDIGLRVPDELRRIEAACRDRISAEIKRGKLDCTLKCVVSGDAETDFDIDIGAVTALGRLERSVRETLPRAAPLTVGDVLRWPGVVREPRREYAELEAQALDCLQSALATLHEARVSEGQRIGGFIEQRVAAILECIESVRPIVDVVEQRYRNKLLDRLAKLEVAAQPDRIEQELVLIAQRLDISEEIDRLASHVDEIRAVLRRDEPIGRRLDFLIQELNREANTLGSKSQDEQLTRTSVELKVLIEQMREQAQNVE
jgi:uncharacterized protein (TIGR00255 family)